MQTRQTDDTVVEPTVRRSNAVSGKIHSKTVCLFVSVFAKSEHFCAFTHTRRGVE